jgi:hypothetical protein
MDTFQHYSRLSIFDESTLKRHISDDDAVSGASKLMSVISRLWSLLSFCVNLIKISRLIESAFYSLIDTFDFIQIVDLCELSPFLIKLSIFTSTYFLSFPLRLSKYFFGFLCTFLYRMNSASYIECAR